MIASTFEKTASAYNGLSTVQAARRARRAYLGLHGLAYDFAVKQTNLRYDQLVSFTSDLVSRGEAVEKDATEFFETAKDKVEDTVEDIKGRVEDMMPKTAKVAVEIEVKPTSVKKVAKKPVAKKATVKKTTVKTTTVKKAAAKKTATKPVVKTKVVAKADIEPTLFEEAMKTPAIKPAAKTVETPKVPAKNTVAIEKAAEVVAENVADKYEDYVADVLRYDATADAAIVKKIVDHCGIALESRDGKFVACTDETERTTVRESWLKKKLGLESVDADLDSRVMAVCDMMKADRFKNRVTFYYMLAKEDGKLASL